MSSPSPDDLSRRRFVRVGGGTALALVIGGAAGIIDRSGDETDSSSSPTTTTSVPIPEVGEVDPAIVALGERVATIRDFTDPVAVFAMLDLDGAATDPDPLEQAAQMVRDDFAARRTVEIDGWVLAESEANAAAIVFLLCQEDGSC